MAVAPNQIRAVVAVVVLGDRVLAMRRSKHAEAAPGAWETLSGRLEPGETELEAVRREISEESGLEVIVEREPVDAYDAERRGMPMRVTVFRAEWLAGDVRPSAEHDEWRWVTAEEFASLTEFPRLAEAVLRAMATRK
jgi:8-oxo-dGTP diphosphatase